MGNGPMTIRLDNIGVRIKKSWCLRGVTWDLEPGQQWAVVGGNGSGKSALGQLLCGTLLPAEGTHRLASPAALVSFEALGDVLQHERDQDDSDFLDRIDHGTPVLEFVGPDDAADRDFLGWVTRLGCHDLLERGLRFLSTGEMRKVMILRALVSRPRLLVLDEPFDGLDVEARGALRQVVAAVMAQGVQVVLLLNRFSDLLPEVTHLAYLHAGELVAQGTREMMVGHEALQRLHAFHAEDSPNLPDRPLVQPPLVIAADAPLIAMKDVSVRYGEKTILNGLNWQVAQGEHWKISGPNGAGKSTLLSLITGDNPQAYANDISLFGYQKGSGESVWQIKQHLGVVSALFHQEYRVRVTAKVAVISGLFDSVGVYRSYTPQQEQIALQWLRLLKMEAVAERPFVRLSYGEQRLVLLARALIKQPRVLILDEPCQGVDSLHRQMVLALIDYLGRQGHCQILYVTHHAEDRIPCIQRHLQLVAADGGGFTACIDGAVERGD
jgi:molybdate transport system ATP-binding protein